MLTGATLATSRSGRTLLHIACIVRRPRTAGFHFAGIMREVVGRGVLTRRLSPSTYYPTPPLLPIAAAIVVAIMIWHALQ